MPYTLNANGQKTQIDINTGQPMGQTSTTPSTNNGQIDLKSLLPILQKAQLAKKTGISYDTLFPSPSTTQLAEQKKNTDVSTAAKNYLDTYQSLLSKGDLTSEDAKRQLAFMAGKYNSVAGFGEGGKQLTGTELGILAPTLIKTQRQRDKNLLEKIFGTNPKMTEGLLQEDPATAAEKMKLALKNTNPYLYSQYQNLGATQSQKESGQMTAGGETLNPNLIENIGTNLKDIVMGLPQLGKTAIDMTPVGGVVDILQGKQPDLLKPLKTTINLAGGIVNNLGQTVGVVKDKQGGYTWDPKAAFIHDYNHPVDTALWILPFFKGVKGALAEKGAVVETGTKTGIIDQAISDVAKTTKAGQAARDVATIVPESLVKSEEIMGKALKYTKSNSIEGMAKELETSIPKQSSIIEKWAKNTDATIGPQPLDQIVSQVMEKVSNTTVARANPNLLQTIEENLRKQLSTGQLEGGLTRGEAEATNFEALNNTRKYFTSGKDNWFNQGQPVGSLTNDLNALEWQTANGLKDIMAEADIQGIIKDALDRQHTAFQVSPVLSKMVSKSKGGLNTISMKWSLLRKAWEASGAKVLEDIKIKNARKLQGGTLEQILSKAPEGPVISPTGTQPIIQSKPLPQLSVANKQPLPHDIVENMLKKKGPAQSTRLIRDMRTTKNPVFRAAQDRLLRQSSKRRYK